jgi:hypothetical protein
MKTKQCKTCGETKPVSDYYSTGKGGRWLATDCKSCDGKRANAWKNANPEKRLAYQRKNRDKYRNTTNHKTQQILDGMKARGRKKGFADPEFTKEEIKGIIAGSCSVTGIPYEFDQAIFSKSPWTPTPDRIDSNLGYTKANTQWVCYMYNCMKSEYTSKEVNMLIKALIAKEDF